MERSTRAWIVLLLLGTAAIITSVVAKRSDPAEQPSLNQAAVQAHHEESEPTVAVAKTTSSRPPCSGQQLEIAMDGNIEAVCMGALVTKHNGSVRSHQVATLASPQRWLRVEVAGNAILSAAWGSDVRPEFHCQAGECTGITISKRDAQGARVMTFERTPLSGTLHLSGRIEIPAEQLELACAGQGVSIVTSEGSSQTFCPQGGAGFEIDNDGAKRYRFTNLDNESILVATDQDQRIKQIEYQGEMSLACASSGCGNVQMSAADAEGARRFTFSGATLIETQNGQSNAVLNGSLILPPM